MDAFKAQLERIKQQLAALTATQKMLVAALVSIMVLTMLYWGRYAGNPEMVSLLTTTLTEDEIGVIQQQLKIDGIPCQVDTGKVLVPADRQLEAVESLKFNQMLPQDTRSAFEQMSKTLTPFATNTERETTYNRATEMQLQQIISHWKGVATAKVMINAKNERHIDGTIPPSATVDIQTRGDVDNVRQLARSAADAVAHAVSGLTPSHIGIIINEKSISVSDSDGLGGTTEQMELKVKTENDIAQKIRDVFPIPGLTVTVNCDVESKTIHEESTKFGKKEDVLTLPNETKEHSEESTSSPQGPREPGAVSNTGGGGSGGLSVDGSGGGGGDVTSSTVTDDTTRNENYVNNTHTITDTPAGKPVALSATVRVPLSYFAAAFKVKYPSIKEPTDDAIQKFTDAKLDSIRGGVKSIAGLKLDDELSVDSYEDIPNDLAMAAGTSVPSATLSTVGGHAKEIALGVLAVVSLFLMASMVRKSTPATIVMPQLAGMGGPIPVGSEAGGFAGEVIAGEVGAGDAALDGMELNDEDVRTQQMLDQVTTMVKENPDSAAALVKRWLSRP
jgi:flagellar biosynthesis/type III secretory pathway M-ring protein FliF/YscJ